MWRCNYPNFTIILETCQRGRMKVTQPTRLPLPPVSLLHPVELDSCPLGEETAWCSPLKGAKERNCSWREKMCVYSLNPSPRGSRWVTGPGCRRRMLGLPTSVCDIRCLVSCSTPLLLSTGVTRKLLGQLRPSVLPWLGGIPGAPV